MQEVFENIIKKLESLEKVFIKGNSHNVAAGISRAIEIVKQESAEYEECYKDCGECEAYNKEKHHCPKFCKVITDSVNEIEENHNVWIPVSERLPEEHKLYDITTKNESGIHSDTAIYNPLLGMWFWDEAENWPIGIEVLAWSEKREPYQPMGE